MAFYQIPTIEQIYNEFHRQRWYAMNGVYPRTVKNFNSIYSDQVKQEYLLRFQNLLKRSCGMIDWKLYILANAQLLKQSFTLKHLGSLGAMRVYRNYILYKFKEVDGEDNIYNEIINSLQFFNAFFKENEMKFKDYILENANVMPLLLVHIYAGTISPYFYGCFSDSVLHTIFNVYQNDVFYELFNVNKYEFINNMIIPKRHEMVKYPKIRLLSDKINTKFFNELNK